MEEFFWSLRTIDSFTYYVLFVLAAAVAWFIKEIVGSNLLAAVSVPVLMVGGVLSYRCFQLAMVTIVPDKDANVVITSAVGAFIALLLMILSVWLTARAREARSRKRRVLPVATPETGH